MCLLAAILAVFLFQLFIMSFLFPLPVNDSSTLRYRTVPWATLALITVNTLLFVLWITPTMYEHQDGVLMVRDDFEPFRELVNVYGYREDALKAGTGIGAFATFTHMFMHADFWHLFGNMIYLWTFGRRVEDACGTWRFLLFYLTAGMIAGIGAALLEPGIGALPGIGSSGAISGVMGAYLLLFHGAKVDVLWGLGAILRLPYATLRLLWNREAKFWRWTVSLPAALLLVLFLVQNAIPSIETIQGDDQLQGVNYLAHLSGFFAGLSIFLFARKDLLVRYLHGRSL